MKLRYVLAFVLTTFTFVGVSQADEVTFTFVNLSNATFEADKGQLVFGNAVNVLVTDNTNGKSMTLTALDSGNTGAATHFAPGPPLQADYSGSGPASALVAASGHVFLSGTVLDGGRLEADYPDKAGAFLSRFHVDIVDPAVLTSLGTSTHFSPDGSVSLTLAETSFDGTTLHAVLGGGEFTITTEAPVPESPSAILLMIGGTVIAGLYWFRQQKGAQ